jgi:FG-GAP-like repeat
MIRKFRPTLCGLVLVSASVFAQTGFHPTPVQQPNPAATDTPSPPGMPGPGLPPGPNASADVCGGQFPDGGAPYFFFPETSAQRLSRLGTNEDPGCDPDPQKVFSRFGQQYTIEKYNREWSVYTGGRDAYQIRPFGFVNAYKELYQHNDKFVWVWQRVPDPANAQPLPEDLQKSTESNNRYSEADVKYLESIRSEFFELTPAETAKTVRFTEASDGLPTTGSWRNGLAIADMNGDGFPDIIAPPERAGGTGIPAIFLGDGKGHWKYWQEARWPHGLDYGTVAAGDFNKDGHMDLAFAVHLSGIFVMLGDGKGNFTEISEGLPRDFATRRLIVTDVDKDGYPDIVAISEGPTATGVQPTGKVRVYYNRDHGKRWEGVDVATPQTRVGGDYLTAANFKGDKYPDIIAGNIYQGSPDVVFLSASGGKQWSKLDSRVGTVIPFMSFYLASAAGKYTSKKNDDVILSYVRFWPNDVNEKLIPKPAWTEVTGLDRLSYNNGTPKRTPIVRWNGKLGITGVAAADIDGDGKLDIIYTAFRGADTREIGLLLGDGKGGFTRAKLDGLTAERKVTYDLKVADVNGDGRPDVIIMYEADQVTAFSPRNGSIHVFLNQGPEPVARVADR